MKLAANLSTMFHESEGLIKRKTADCCFSCLNGSFIAKFLANCYASAAKCGFRFVECAYPYEKNLEELKIVKEKFCLEQILINVPVGEASVQEDKGLVCIPKKVPEFRKSIDLAITYAKGLNCNRVHVIAGLIPKDESYENVERTYLDNLQFAADKLAKENIMCLIEPINPISIPNFFLNSYDQALRYINTLQRPNLKLQLDIFHLQMICGNLTNNIKRFLPYTGHIQIAQAPDRHEPDSQGEINYEYVFSLLEALKYDQYIGCEYLPIADTVTGLEWIKRYKHLI